MAGTLGRSSQTIVFCCRNYLTDAPAHPAGCAHHSAGDDFVSHYLYLTKKITVLLQPVS
jgi:hypothetical protein